jgi:hypothetical protein
MMRSEIKIRTSSLHKTNLALCGDEVRIVIFDDPAEREQPQRPFLEALGGDTVNPARDRRAGAMRQFPTNYASIQ